MDEEVKAIGWVSVKGRLRYKPAVLQVCDYVQLERLAYLCLSHCYKLHLCFFYKRDGFIRTLTPRKRRIGGEFMKGT